MKHHVIRYTIEELLSDDLPTLYRKVDGAHMHGEEAEHVKGHVRNAQGMAKSGRLDGYNRILISYSGITELSGTRRLGGLKIK